MIGADDDSFRRRPLGRAQESDAQGEKLGVPLLQHKLGPPRTYLALVQRRALVDWLLHVETPLVVFSAPAGSGKTSTLVQWTQAERRPVAWVSLEAADADPAVFLVLSDLGDRGGRRRPAGRVCAASGERLTQAGPRVLAALVGGHPEAAPFVLVLDDCHNVRSRRCWNAVATLMEQLPSGGRIALSGRRDPPLPLARLRTTGRLAELRMEGLALDKDEAAQLLQLHGAPTDEGTLAAVMHITEGWAAGVYLSAVLAEPLPPDDWLPHLRGDQREIARYLTAEVLARLPQRTRSFLEETSILDRLSADLCRAVTGRDDAGDELERAAGQSLFVTALDDHGEWYRYHHLFAELLRAELVRHQTRTLARPAPGRRGVVPGAPRARGCSRPLVGRRRRRLSHGSRESGTGGGTRRRQGAGLGAAAAPVERGADPGRPVADPLRRLDLRPALGHARGAEALGDPGVPHRGRRKPLADRARPPCGRFRRSFEPYLAPDGITRMVRDAELCVKLETDPARGWYLLSRSALAIALYLAGRGGPAARMLDDLAVREPRALDRAIVLNVLSLLAGDEGNWERAETSIAGRSRRTRNW